MLHPSEDEYIPLNSNAPNSGSYMSGAAVMLVFYDQLLTLDKEMDLIWTLPWRLPKVLFLINRYLVPPLLPYLIISAFTAHTAYQVCDVQQRLGGWAIICGLAAAQGVLCVRLCAAYSHSRYFRWAMVMLLAAEICATSITFAIWASDHLHAVNEPDGLSVCVSNAVNMRYAFWLPFLIGDAIMVGLMLYKLYCFRNEMNATIALLARDSILYFLFMFIALLLDVIPDVFASALPPQAIACIGVSRMMMNIRGLIADDPAHNMHLKTLPNIAVDVESPHVSLAGPGENRNDDPESLPLVDIAGDQHSR
ncbi:hypothetical protein FIBSPDRAFT_1039101 [Athelia psychrophila]|uniref:DUF6533 domain-containing protein n=1 Tax=Athelia psychrophila TaxID=1759441 RepID=A0A166S7D7_9AGAM|nr:hypothetical protein FIBSPDRAFT_1039101 [Fibularhizoctonia sp. CBS 109695]